MGRKMMSFLRRGMQAPRGTWRSTFLEFLLTLGLVRLGECSIYVLLLSPHHHSPYLGGWCILLLVNANVWHRNIAVNGHILHSLVYIWPLLRTTQLHIFFFFLPFLEAAVISMRVLEPYGDYLLLKPFGSSSSIASQKNATIKKKKSLRR